MKFVKKWYWFIFSVFLFLSIAFLKVRYTLPQYSVSGTIMIAPEENISQSELSAFKDMGLFDNTKSKIENEIQIIKSRTLITNVVNKLDLNIQYYSQGRILEVENYPKSLLEINLLGHDSIVKNRYRVFRIKINSPLSYSLIDEDEKKLSTHSFGKTYKDPVIGNFVITPRLDKVDKKLKGNIIKIKISPVNNIAEYYRNRLVISPVGKSSTIVRLSVSDAVKEKATDIINNLIEEYNNATVESKKQISAKTADFINKRLDLISGDLSSVDTEAADYKSSKGLSLDVSAQANSALQYGTQTKQQIRQIQTQLQLVQSMSSFIQNQGGQYELIPSNLGFDDPSITGTVGRYNSLILRRKQLLKSSSIQNPVVVNLDEQINGLRQVLMGSLNSLKSTIKIQLSSLQNQSSYFSGTVYNAPESQKDLRVIEREQTIKEQLFLYLLQKREEAEITSNVTLSNIRIIDKASVLSAFPISPNSKMIYMAALLLGLAIPFLTIYLIDLLNVKISSREDIENVLSMPILGSIPKTKEKNKIVISKSNRSGVAEAFRILRTNVDFLMAGNTKKSGKIIFVTSTISGEGKTMISSNLAKTLAISGKKVAYVGTDFRDPKFHKFLELPQGKQTKGFTNFITNSDLNPSDVIYTQKDEDPFDIIPSGVIPPNPAELLMQDRVKVMFEYLENNYDFVIVDTAPVSLVTDTLLIGSLSDLSIYVVRENYSDKRMLQIPENFYAENRLPNMAVLLNAAQNKGGYNYGYGYGYGSKK